MSEDRVVELVLGLLAGMAVLAVLARRLRIPYPIAFVVGGGAVALLPVVPEVRLPPDLVFLIFLPPLIYESGATTPLHGLRANGWAIGALAFGLVIATAAGVTAVAHATVPGLAGPAAFVLGAIIAPADIVVAEAVAERLSVPRRIMILVEGEGLFNDATALVLFRMAVSAALVGRSRSSRPACSLCWPRWAGPPSATSWGGSRCERGGSSTTPWST